jgi:tripartite-type tricarboxylate transporter receptor subunit TctC
MIKRRNLLAAAGAAPLWATLPAYAGKYPERPVKIVIPFPAGGPTDAIGRVFARDAARSLGQPLVVENKGGAGGLTASAEVARAAADGYTLLMNPSVQVVWPALIRELRFDPIHDFRPVALLGLVPLVAVVPVGAPYRSLQDLVQAAKREPTRLTYASPGVGSFMHLAGEFMNSTAGMQTTHVPYKGSAPAITDVAGGHVDLMYAPLATALPLIKGNKLRPLAVTSARRLPALPGVPTFAEAGFPSVEISTWYGVWAPKGTPADVVERLNAAFRAATESESVKAVLAEQGTEAEPMAQTAFAQFVDAEHRRWTRVVKDAGIHPE